MEGLTQDGSAYCGIGRAGASNADWPNGDRAYESGRENDASSTEKDLADCRESLARTIEAEIIPRLMLLHRSSYMGDGDEQGIEERDPELPETDELCDLLLTASVSESMRLVEEMVERPIALDVIYLALFAPAAKRLGELWEADLCSFADVTIGLGRLQQLMHCLSHDFRSEADRSLQGRRALLVGVPGEQHTLGLFMVSEFFRRAGWDVWNEPPFARETLTALAAAERFDIIGLSAGSVTRVDLIAAVVAEVRAASLNRNVAILVGGPLFSASPTLAAKVGADGMAADARDALDVAEQLLSRFSTG